MQAASIEIVQCAVCEQAAEQWVVPTAESTNPPDFDTRPAEPERSLLAWSVSWCSSCGYCANDLSVVQSGVEAVVSEERYQLILQDQSVPPPARPFLCFSLILERMHQWADAGWSSLHAAWICDDSLAEEAGKRCRLASLRQWRQAKELGVSFGDDLASEFALATDLYRRAGQFTEAQVTCADALDIDDIPSLLNQLLRRQLVLIQQKDTSCHSMTELLSRAN